MPYRFIGPGLEPADWFRLLSILVAVAISVMFAALTMQPADWLPWGLASAFFCGATIYGFRGE
jgi:hypothetical protein